VKIANKSDLQIMQTNTESLYRKIW